MVNFWKNLPKPFTVLAPMENVTDFVFREIVARELPKPNVMFTEFTNIESLLSKGYEANITKFRFGRTQRPMVAQIWGTNPESFYKVAKMIQELGFDGVDINMGCPVHEVMKIGGGAAMIDNQKLTKEVIEAVKKGANNLPISVKTRIGTKSVTTDKWTTFLLEQKIDALTIHGRTAKQMSKGLADWNEIAKVVKIKNQIAPETIIIGNGDIENYEQVINAHEKYGVDGIMIGRGIFKNPWIFDPTSPRLSMTRKEYIDVLLKHLDLYEKNWRDTKSPEPMKKFYKMYINNFKGANILRQKLMETKNFEEAKELLKI
jgi:nifR3 family TIM-barrel protein